jgi:hypothetical protein
MPRRPSKRPVKAKLARARKAKSAQKRACRNDQLKFCGGILVLYSALAERAAYEGNIAAFDLYWEKQRMIGGDLTPKCAKRAARHEKRIEESGIHWEIEAAERVNRNRRGGDGPARVQRDPVPLAPTSSGAKG